MDTCRDCTPHLTCERCTERQNRATRELMQHGDWHPTKRIHGRRRPT